MGKGAGKRSAADLDEQGIRLRPTGDKAFHHFEPQSARAFDRQAVVRTLHAKGDRAAAHRLPKTAHAGIGGLARPAVADRNGRAQIFEPLDHRIIGVARNVHISGHSAARAITAAASAALPQDDIASRRARKPTAAGSLPTSRMRK